MKCAARRAVRNDNRLCNRRLRPQDLGDGRWCHQRLCASRLTGWQRGTDSATYTYDGNGQRTSATVTMGGTTTTTDYTYDGITLLSLDAARSDETTYAIAYLTDEDGRPYAGVYTAGAASPVTFLIAATDRGDVVALTDTAGDVFARYTYDPYGAVLSQETNAVTSITSDVAAAIATRQPLRYAGYAYDAHSATYYLSQRYYDPATMRFLTKDPARDDGEESAYQYCAGDPVGRVDPTGLLAITWSRAWYLKDLTRRAVRYGLYNYMWGRVFAGAKWLAGAVFPKGSAVRNFFTQGRVYDSWWFRQVRMLTGPVDRTISGIADTASYATLPFLLSYWDYSNWGTKLVVSLTASTVLGMVAAAAIHRYISRGRPGSGYRVSWRVSRTIASATSVRRMALDYYYLSTK